MLSLIGIGISGYKGLSLAAIDFLSKCDIVYAENFTSPLSSDDLEGLKSILKKTVELVDRSFVEDGREILEKARSKDVSLLTYGDPLIATTHTELCTRAVKNSIKVRCLHNASGVASTIGESGLHVYKFGRTVTIMSEPQSALSVYNIIYDNLLNGSHTLLLTEYWQEESKKSSFFLDPHTVFKLLLEVEAAQRYHIFSFDTFAIVASRIGMENQKVVSGKVNSLMQKDFGSGPHSIIITGAFHFTEADAVSSLTENIDPPSDNTQAIERIAAQMIARYAPKAKLAVQQMRTLVQQETKSECPNKGIFDVLDNAEYYIADAERFLRQNRLELAVLSIGYAEGLVDSLRFQKDINPWDQPS
jgi:diphthine synthase